MSRELGEGLVLLSKIILRSLVKSLEESSPHLTKPSPQDRTNREPVGKHPLKPISMNLGALQRPWRGVTRIQEPENILWPWGETRRSQLISAWYSTQPRGTPSCWTRETVHVSSNIRWYHVSYTSLWANPRKTSAWETQVTDLSRPCERSNLFLWSDPSQAVWRLTSWNVKRQRSSWVWLLWCHVEAIRPRHQIIELIDRFAVPILKSLRKISKHLIPILEVKNYVAARGGPSPRICANKTVILQPHSQNWEQSYCCKETLYKSNPMKIFKREENVPLPRELPRSTMKNLTSWFQLRRKTDHLPNWPARCNCKPRILQILLNQASLMSRFSESRIMWSKPVGHVATACATWCS